MSTKSSPSSSSGELIDYRQYLANGKVVDGVDSPDEVWEKIKKSKLADRCFSQRTPPIPRLISFEWRSNNIQKLRADREKKNDDDPIEGESEDDGPEEKRRIIIEGLIEDTIDTLIEMGHRTNPKDYSVYLTNHPEDDLEYIELVLKTVRFTNLDIGTIENKLPKKIGDFIIILPAKERLMLGCHRKNNKGIKKIFDRGDDPQVGIDSSILMAPDKPIAQSPDRCYPRAPLTAEMFERLGVLIDKQHYINSRQELILAARNINRDFQPVLLKIWKQAWRGDKVTIKMSTSWDDPEDPDYGVWNYLFLAWYYNRDGYNKWKRRYNIELFNLIKIDFGQLRQRLNDLKKESDGRHGYERTVMEILGTMAYIDGMYIAKSDEGFKKLYPSQMKEMTNTIIYQHAKPQGPKDVKGKVKAPIKGDLPKDKKGTQDVHLPTVWDLIQELLPSLTYTKRVFEPCTAFNDLRVADGEFNDFKGFLDHPILCYTERTLIWFEKAFRKSLPYVWDYMGNASMSPHIRWFPAPIFMGARVEVPMEFFTNKFFGPLYAGMISPEALLGTRWAQKKRLFLAVEFPKRYQFNDLERIITHKHPLLHDESDKYINYCLYSRIAVHFPQIWGEIVPYWHSPPPEWTSQLCGEIRHYVINRAGGKAKELVASPKETDPRRAYGVAYTWRDAMGNKIDKLSMASLHEGYSLPQGGYPKYEKDKAFSNAMRVGVDEVGRTAECRLYGPKKE